MVAFVCLDVNLDVKMGVLKIQWLIRVGLTHGPLVLSRRNSESLSSKSSWVCPTIGLQASHLTDD